MTIEEPNAIQKRITQRIAQLEQERQALFFNGTNTVTGDTGMTYNSSTNALTISGPITTNGVATFNGGLQTTTNHIWSLGAWTSNVDTAINGYILVNVDGTARKIATI